MIIGCVLYLITLTLVISSTYLVKIGYIEKEHLSSTIPLIVLILLLATWIMLLKDAPKETPH